MILNSFYRINGIELSGSSAGVVRHLCPGKMKCWHFLLKINLTLQGCPSPALGLNTRCRVTYLIHGSFPPVATFTESNQAKISPSLFNHSLFQTMIYHHLYLDYITFRLHMLQGRRNNVFPSPAKALASETQHFYPAVSQFEGLNMHARKPAWIPLQAAEGRLLLVHEERLFWSGDAIKWTFMWVYSSAGSL